MTRPLRALLCSLVCASSACGGGTGGNDAADGGGQAAGWTYHEIEGGACGNGSPFGVATNLQPGSTDVLVFLAGGGACWDAETCYVLGSAVHIDEDVGAATVLAEARAGEAWLFSRQPGVGPLPDASFVYVPYCTGDLHAGRRLAEYTAQGETKTAHHVGGENLDRLLEQWDDLLPSPERLLVSGISAGGYGATLNWWRFRERFANASAVDVLDDSGPATDAPSERFAAWDAAWDLELPPDCDDCAEGFSRLLPHYLESMPPSDRYAYLSFESDGVIALFYGVGGDVIAAKHAALRETLEQDARMAGFFLPGGEHVVLADPSRAAQSGVSAAEWVGQFLADSPEWTTTGP